MIPITKLGSASDPQLSVVMTHDPAGFINQTTAISGEEPTARYGVEVPPWINPVSKRHLPIMAAVADRGSTSVVSQDMSSTEVPTEPGWYDHPEGRKGMQRYWNGESWSGAPRKKPPELTSSGVLLIVTGTIVFTVVLVFVMRNLF